MGNVGANVFGTWPIAEANIGYMILSHSDSDVVSGESSNMREAQ